MRAATVVRAQSQVPVECSITSSIAAHHADASTTSTANSEEDGLPRIDNMPEYEYKRIKAIFMMFDTVPPHLHLLCPPAPPPLLWIASTVFVALSRLRSTWCFFFCWSGQPNGAHTTAPAVPNSMAEWRTGRAQGTCTAIGGQASPFPSEAAIPLFARTWLGLSHPFLGSVVGRGLNLVSPLFLSWRARTRHGPPGGVSTPPNQDGP